MKSVVRNVKKCVSHVLIYQVIKLILAKLSQCSRECDKNLHSDFVLRETSAVLNELRCYSLVALKCCNVTWEALIETCELGH